ncbi:MAG: Ku protein, partial [Lapillicoccus sp.]
GDYDPEEFEDDYAQAVEAMVEAKLAGGEVKAAPAAKDGSGEVVDLFEALQRSVDKAKASRGEPVTKAASTSTRDDDEDTAQEDLAPESDQTTGKKATARATSTKAAATKTAATKTAAKKATASKTAAKKTAAKKAS